MNLKGKTTLITGSARGIGKTVAMQLAKEGANIIVNDIEPMKEEAEKTVEEIKALGVESVFVAGDVSKYESITGMINKIKEKFDKVDILVNNAGITKDRTLKKMAPEEWYPVINVNLNGVYNVTKQVLPLMPDGGRIINISSICGISGNFGQCNYSATKAALIGFTKSLSKELGRHQITVNAVAPGFIESAMTEKIPLLQRKMLVTLIPLGEMGQMQDIADAVAFLASNRARYISGEVIRVDGGMLG
ncbi:beta-ketoacyl-ACP reductase [Candidatus Woesearchaeota archaeon]|nr:beta-ketoacyl-ACP reductase [Candidatus Woesearchaeota archaeon]